MEPPPPSYSSHTNYSIASEYGAQQSPSEFAANSRQVRNPVWPELTRNNEDARRNADGGRRQHRRHDGRHERHSDDARGNARRQADDNRRHSDGERRNARRHADDNRTHSDGERRNARRHERHADDNRGHNDDWQYAGQQERRIDDDTDDDRRHARRQARDDTRHDFEDNTENRIRKLQTASNTINGFVIIMCWIKVLPRSSIFRKFYQAGVLIFFS